MSKKDGTVIGVGVAACVVCCAGPILGVLAAIGISTAAGYALFGAIAILIGAAATAFVLIRRRERADACASADSPAPVPVELIDTRSR